VQYFSFLCYDDFGCFARFLSTLSCQVLSDGTLLMKEVRENIEELTCQVLLPQIINISVMIMRIFITIVILAAQHVDPTLLGGEQPREGQHQLHCARRSRPCCSHNQVDFLKKTPLI